MAQFQAKQINKAFIANFGISGFTTSGGTSDTITGALTTAVGTAGNGGASVPLQVGSVTAPTLGISPAPFNLATVYVNGTKDFYLDTNGQEVYGKIANSGSNWTLSYFSVVNGIETAFTMPASASIDFEVPYVYSFDLLPAQAFIATQTRHIAPNPSSLGQRWQGDALTVTATNTLSALSRAYVGPFALLIVNGQTMTNFGSGAPFSVSGTVVTWSAANAGYALATTDEVKITYGY